MLRKPKGRKRFCRRHGNLPAGLHFGFSFQWKISFSVVAAAFDVHWTWSNFGGFASRNVHWITHIGTRGMFVGAATEIEITYRKPDGRKHTVGYGTSNFLNPKDLRRVLDALVDINPSLRLPPELVEKLPR